MIAPSFGDIFFENSLKNGLLPVVLEPDGVTALAGAIAAAPSPVLTVDLEACTVGAPSGPHLSFAIQQGRRRNLLLGLDEIGQTLTHGADIERFQAADRVHRPWIYPERVRARPGSARA